MPLRLPISWLCALPALAALTATAQVNTPPQAPVPTTAKASAVVPTAAASLPYRSVFDSYQPFTDQKVLPWKETNATVEKIGGWRAYAKEAAEPAAADRLAPASSTTPAANPHAGHGKQ